MSHIQIELVKNKIKIKTLHVQYWIVCIYQFWGGNGQTGVWLRGSTHQTAGHKGRLGQTASAWRGTAAPDHRTVMCATTTTSNNATNTKQKNLARLYLNAFKQDLHTNHILNFINWSHHCFAKIMFVRHHNFPCTKWYRLYSYL